MSLVLAIEPDPKQAAVVKQVVRDQAGADVVLADSKDAALAAIAERVPDLILVTALLSPRDETELTDHLRDLEGAEHLQTLTIPQLAGAARPSKKKRRGLLGALTGESSGRATPAGCDPAVFAREVADYLARAEEMKAEAAAQRDQEARKARREKRRKKTAAVDQGPGAGAQSGSGDPAAPAASSSYWDWNGGPESSTTTGNSPSGPARASGSGATPAPPGYSSWADPWGASAAPAPGDVAAAGVDAGVTGDADVDAAVPEGSAADLIASAEAMQRRNSEDPAERAADTPTRPEAVVSSVEDRELSGLEPLPPVPDDAVADLVMRPAAATAADLVASAPVAAAETDAGVIDLSFLLDTTDVTRQAPADDSDVYTLRADLFDVGSLDPNGGGAPTVLLDVPAVATPRPRRSPGEGGTEMPPAMAERTREPELGLLREDLDRLRDERQAAETALADARDAQARAESAAAEAAARASEEADAARRAREDAERRADEEAQRRAEAERRAEEQVARITREAREAQARRDAEVAEARAREEAARFAEAEQRAREDAERLAQEVAEREAREQAERRVRDELERRAREEVERLTEAARRAQEQAEQLAREVAQREAREVAERQAREQAERRAREQAEQLAREAAERGEREQAERRAREEAERRADAERRAREDAEHRAESEKRAREQTERRAREEAVRLAREAADRAAREELERKAREDAERRAAAERKAREEAERRAREETVRLAREAAERQVREQTERRAREAAERRADAERRAREAAERKAQEAAERHEREQAERQARKQAKQQRRADPPKRAGQARPKPAPPRARRQEPPRPSSTPRPVQDEWGLYDPNTCGFDALYAKLESIEAGTDVSSEEPTAGERLVSSAAGAGARARRALRPLAMWAWRAVDTPSPAPVNEPGRPGKPSTLVEQLSLPTAAAAVRYATGARVRRVRVSAAHPSGGRKSGAASPIIILSRKALADLRSAGRS